MGGGVGMRVVDIRRYMYLSSTKLHCKVFLPPPPCNVSAEPRQNMVPLLLLAVLLAMSPNAKRPSHCSFFRFRTQTGRSEQPRAPFCSAVGKWRKRAQHWLAS